MARKLLIALVLIGLPMAVLYPLWTRPITAGEDDFVFYWPVRQIVADRLRSGELPVWNPYMCGGVPLLADPQSAVLYPPHALFLVLPDTLAYSLCVFAVFATAGGGAYLYLRRIALAPAPAMFGAVAFMFCGFLAAHRAHLSMLEAAALLPWGLWCIEKLRTRAISAFLWMVPVFFLALAAGHWPTAVQMTIVWLAYLLLRGRPIGRALLTAGAAVGVGLLLMGPQIVVTASYLRHSVRADLPYVVVTENSLFPLCAVLAFLPAIMCYRTPQFLPQGWWGPWHLCEMLGYVGLATMALAATAVWRLYRKPEAPPSRDERADPPKLTDSRLWGPGARASDLTPLVRAWTWILIGAGLWALGFYLPTYRLIYRIPVVGMVRCPARMLLTIDFALAALAAITVQALAAGPAAKLARTARRWAGRYLPLCIVGSYGLLWLVLTGARLNWWHVSDLFSARPGTALAAMQAALHPLSSAVYVPVLAAAATAAAVWWFLRRPQRRAWVLVVLVLVDLLYVVRLIDAPTRRVPSLVPVDSPAGEWLREHGGSEPYRVWGLSASYHERSGELLLPMTCGPLGVESISSYGPLQPVEHARLLGFRCWGEAYEREWLIRRNHLLSLFNVRYVVGAGEAFHELMRSVRIPERPPPAEGPELLAGDWTLRGGRRDGGTLHLRAPSVFASASATQEVRLVEGELYRAAMELRAPGGAGHLVALRYVMDAEDASLTWYDLPMLRVDAEQITPRWRHFETVFRAPAGGRRPLLELLVLSDRAVEVRNVTLRRSQLPAPVNLGGRLKPGERVYVDRTPGGLPLILAAYPARRIRPDGVAVPVDLTDVPRVHVYENRLCLPRSFPAEPVFLDDEAAVVEALRWRPEAYDLTKQVLMSGEPRWAGPVRFVGERRHVLDRQTYRPGNVLGSVRRAGAAAGPPRTRWWLLGLPAAGLAAFLGGGVLARRTANRRRFRDVE